jgi:hypothetical protein
MVELELIGFHFRTIDNDTYYCGVTTCRNMAGFLLDRPAILPPGCGPDQAYFCVDCLGDLIATAFVASMGIDRGE